VSILPAILTDRGGEFLGEVVEALYKRLRMAHLHVLGVDDDQDIISIRTSKLCSQWKYHVNLMMLTDQNKFHYISIQFLSRLVTSRIKYNGKNIYATIVCIRLIEKIILICERSIDHVCMTRHYSFFKVC